LERAFAFGHHCTTQDLPKFDDSLKTQLLIARAWIDARERRVDLDLADSAQRSQGLQCD